MSTYGYDIVLYPIVMVRKFIRELYTCSEVYDSTIYYGVQNNKYSKFFNRSSGGSITCTGRYLISLNGIVCEMFAGNIALRMLEQSCI